MSKFKQKVYQQQQNQQTKYKFKMMSEEKYNFQTFADFKKYKYILTKI